MTNCINTKNVHLSVYFWRIIPAAYHQGAYLFSDSVPLVYLCPYFGCCCLLSSLFHLFI